MKYCVFIFYRNTLLHSCFLGIEMVLVPNIILLYELLYYNSTNLSLFLLNFIG